MFLPLLEPRAQLVGCAGIQAVGMAVRVRACLRARVCFVCVRMCACVHVHVCVRTHTHVCKSMYSIWGHTVCGGPQARPRPGARYGLQAAAGWGGWRDGAQGQRQGQGAGCAQAGAGLGPHAARTGEVPSFIQRSSSLPLCHVPSGRMPSLEGHICTSGMLMPSSARIMPSVEHIGMCINT